MLSCVSSVRPEIQPPTISPLRMCLVVDVHGANDEIPIPISSLKTSTRLVRASTAIDNLQHSVGHIRAVRRLVLPRNALRVDLRRTRVTHLDNGCTSAADATRSCSKSVEIVEAGDDVVHIRVCAIVGTALQSEEGSVDIAAGYVKRIC